MIKGLEEKLREVLPAILEARNSYLVELKILPGKVEVFADSDPHITIDDCAFISGVVQQKLNAVMPFAVHYTLEVSSPGMDQPLLVLRQYKKRIGHEVDVILHSGAKKIGVLLYADEEKIQLEEKLKSKERTEEKLLSEIPFHQIKSTKIVFNF